MTLHAHEFSEDVIDDALERLEASGLPREERRTMEQRLREMRGYAGFTCQIELSFDLAPRTYVFELRTEWFDELDEILDEIDGASGEENEKGPLGGYYSNN